MLEHGNLGKCLLFYLKYPAEMERLYEEEEIKADGLPNPDANLAKIRLVGDTACREAADLLARCAPGIEEHFRTIAFVQRVRSNLEALWDLRFRVAPARAKRRRFAIGVGLDPYRAALAPWIWCRGGRRAEDEIVHILDRGIKSATLGWVSGAIALTEIKIPIPERLDELISTEPLIRQVESEFSTFTAEQVKAIAMVAGKS